MKSNSNSKIDKENGQKAISKSLTHCKMNISKNLKYLIDYMIISIKLMRLRRTKKLKPIKWCNMSKMNLFMKNKSCSWSKRNYKSSKIWVAKLIIKNLKILNNKIWKKDRCLTLNLKHLLLYRKKRKHLIIISLKGLINLLDRKFKVKILWAKIKFLKYNKILLLKIMNINLYKPIIKTKVFYQIQNHKN